MIKVTKAQYEALEIFFGNQRGLRTQLGCISKMHGKWEGSYKPLNDLPFEDFAELLVMGQYEVKRTIEEVIDGAIEDSKIDPFDNGSEYLISLKDTLKMEGLI
ncbi:hypothetical protein LEO2_60 [Bacillus phage Leo2]|uniref:Uncharacterized protein n=1 Tax=Bacillus phage Leo2 TaxID=1815973 RepID=A0A1S5QTR6_9CAUD|nr:hypothetical protein LEO2_60 [Bacillus phage Leo2]